MSFPVLKIGSVGVAVKALQEALNRQSYNGNFKLAIDSVFGERTLQAVKLFQLQKKLEVDGIVGYNTAKALGLVLPPEKMIVPNYLMLHCSATPERSAGANAKQIVDYHVNKLGWGRPGYSRIVEYDGKIVETWKVDLTDGFQPFEITYGALEWNPVSVHICYIGGMNREYTAPKNTLTPEQDASFQKIIREVIAQCPEIQILGHNQAHLKACPSFWVPDYLERLGIPEKHIYRKDPFGQAEQIRRL